MLSMLLCALIVLSLSALYVSRKKASRVYFDAFTDYYLYFVLAHALFAMMAEHFFSSFSFAGLLLPFGLAYGPFLYFGVRMYSGERETGGQLYLHFIPFFVIAFVNLIVLYGFFGPTDYESFIFSLYYLLMALSLAGYAVWIFISDRADMKRLCSIIGFCLVVAGLLFAVIVLARPLISPFTALNSAAFVMYGGALLSVIALFGFKVNSAIAAVASEPKVSEPIEIVTELDSEVIQGKYSKSGLATPLLKEYKGRLEKLFEEDHTYLDNDLTLVLLAEKLRIPAHHLTQLFNVYIGENFNQYVNKYRVEYACMMLADVDEDIFIEDVAYKSGFNSKVSFNRHFKNITGCTPKEYVYKMRK